MKRKIFFLVFISSVFAGHAQTLNTQSDYLAVTIGDAVPTSAFGRADYKNAKHGVAKLGAMIGLDYIKNLNKYIGIGGSIGHQINPFDKVKLAAAYRDDGVSLTEFSSDNYRSTFFMATLLYNHHFNSKANLYLKFNGGLANNIFPEQSFRLNGQAVNFAQSKSTALATGLGLGFRYRFGKMALGLEMLRINTTSEFQIKNNFGVEKTKKPLDTSNIVLTFGYCFW